MGPDGARGCGAQNSQSASGSSGPNRPARVPPTAYRRRSPRTARVIKTIYILCYVQGDDLRRGVQLQLNRGERQHILAKWLFFANRGEFRDGDINEIMNKTSCLSLPS